MTIFETYINGEKVCRSGVEGDCVHTVILTYHLRRESEPGKGPKENKVDVGISGLDVIRNESLQWLMRTLEVGDEVRVVVTEGVKVDAPRERA
jgi:hypothetical protein